MNSVKFKTALLTAFLSLTAGCQITLNSSFANDIRASNVNYIVAIEFKDTSEPNNPVVISTPKISVIGEQEASISIGGSNNQFIEVEVVVNEGEQTVGTIQFNIMKDDRRASGKITTLVGQTASLQTGGFEMKVLFEPQPTDGE